MALFFFLQQIFICYWRKRVYFIANEGFGLGDGTGPAE